MKDTISVVITTFNRPDKLLRCLKAAVNQTSPSHEIIVVNDGSSADYRECKGYAQNDPNVIWLDQPNAGVSAARNHGVDHSTGNFIAFCDDDDYWLPNHLETLHQIINQQNSKPAIYHTHRRELRGKEWHDPPIHHKRADITWQEHYITKGEMIPSATCMHNEVARYSPFPVGIKYAEDHEQRLIALADFPCFPSMTRTVVMDRTDESATNRSIHEIAAIYRGRFHTMFRNPTIRNHIRRTFRHQMLYRWTSLELSEAIQRTPKQFPGLWLKAGFRIRSWSNIKTWVMNFIWFLQSIKTK